MKKVYAKPEIVFENFSLSTNIATGCNHQTSLQSNTNGCGMEWGDEIIFLVGITGCMGEGRTAYDMDDGSSGICYHNPSETNDLFNS